MMKRHRRRRARHRNRMRAANPRMHAAMVALRRSSAAQPHDPRPRRTRTRGEAARRAVADFRED